MYLAFVFFCVIYTVSDCNAAKRRYAFVNLHWWHLQQKNEATFWPDLAHHSSVYACAICLMLSGGIAILLTHSSEFVVSGPVPATSITSSVGRLQAFFTKQSSSRRIHQREFFTNYGHPKTRTSTNSPALSFEI